MGNIGSLSVCGSGSSPACYCQLIAIDWQSCWGQLTLGVPKRERVETWRSPSIQLGIPVSGLLRIMNLWEMLIWRCLLAMNQSHIGLSLPSHPPTRTNSLIFLPYPLCGRGCQGESQGR